MKWEREEGGEPCWCSAVGTEMTDSISASGSARSAARGRASCSAGGKSIQAFAHSSLLLTLVGILQRIVSSQGGRKENKNTSASRGADCGVQASLSPGYCNSRSWGLGCSGSQVSCDPSRLVELAHRFWV